MLVLSRNIGKSFRIDDDIIVTSLGMEGDEGSFSVCSPDMLDVSKDCSDQPQIFKCKTGQSVSLADDVEVRVLESCSRMIRFGIEAPKHIAVHREEIYHRILSQNRIDSIKKAPKKAPK